MSPRPKALVYLIVVAIIWGLASVVIKATLSGIEPVSFLFYRFALSSVLALFSLKSIFALGKKPLATKAWVILYAVVSTPLALGILFVGLTQSTVLTLSIFAALQPIILAVASHFLFGEHLTHRQKIGAGLAFVGSIVSISPEFFNGSRSTTLVGSLLVFVYILVDSGSVLMLKKILRLGVNGTALTHISFVVGFVFLLPVVLVTNPYFLHQVTSLSVPIHLGVIYMAVLSGTVAYAMRAKAQKTIGISEAGFMGYLVPIISTIFAVVVLSEQISLEFALGAALIAAGVFLIEKHKTKTLKS